MEKLADAVIDAIVALVEEGGNYRDKANAVIKAANCSDSVKMAFDEFLSWFDGSEE
jgi:hypothetical protein